MERRQYRKVIDEDATLILLYLSLLSILFLAVLGVASRACQLDFVGNSLNIRLRIYLKVRTLGCKRSLIAVETASKAYLFSLMGRRLSNPDLPRVIDSS
eukprot:6177384-Pleurochrysis_carterae.AAC.5